MIHHTCQDCQRGFTAASFDEAQEEFEDVEHRPNEDFEDLARDGRLAYARYCPYCGGDNIEPI